MNLVGLQTSKDLDIQNFTQNRSTNKVKVRGGLNALGSKVKY